jgi:hypothetical protein
MPIIRDPPPILRHSQRKAKQTHLYSGLIPTPTKTKARQKTAITPKTLKLAIKEAGLEDKLTQTALAAAPLKKSIIKKYVAL